MKILFVENSGDAAYQLAEHLTDDGHDVLLAGDVTEAQDFWDDGGIDCLIVDLNMEPTGLGPKESEETQGGLFTGWVWLKYHVFSQNDAMRRRTIVLTAYERDFREKVPSAEKTGVKVISKRSGQGDVYDEIVNFINMLDKTREKQR